MSRMEVFGAATLYLGDCREILPTLGPVDSLICDPPYGMSFKSNFRLEDHNDILNDGNVEMLQFAANFPVQYSKYIWCRWDNLVNVPKPRSLITWVKNNWSMGDLEHEHARQTEVCLFYPGPKHEFPNGRPTDVVHCPRTTNEFHPTEKPVVLMEKLLDWTLGDVVDCFMGSGTTGVATLKAKRSFIGIELDPKHFDTACRRIEEASKQGGLF